MSKNFEIFQQIDRERQQSSEASSMFVAPLARPRHVAVPEEVREEIGKLLQGLFLMANGLAPRSVLFAAVGEGAEASRVFASMADMLAANVSGAVCVVDCDLKSPTLHRHFAVHNGAGLADLLMDSQSVRRVAVPLADSKLWLVPAGPPVPYCEQLLDSDAMRIAVGKLRAEFDYLLLFAQSRADRRDLLNLTSLMEGVVLLLQANSTRRDLARRLKDDLELAGGRILGAVLYDRTFPIPQSIYSKLHG